MTDSSNTIVRVLIIIIIVYDVVQHTTGGRGRNMKEKTAKKTIYIFFTRRQESIALQPETYISYMVPWTDLLEL